MPRFAANLSLLFTELPYLERFAAAAAAGFTGAEILFPYDLAASETRRALISNGLDFVLMNAPPPNYTGGDPGFAAVPGGEERYRHDMRRVLRYAEVLGPGLIHVMPGYTKAPEAFDTFVANLQWLADTAPRQRFTIEPLNQGDQPGYFLDNYPLAARVLDAVQRPNVGLQYDCYHATVIHGDAIAIWREYGPRAVHIQIGDAPGRTEPGKGTVDFPGLFAAIEASGYDGWISAEYNPTTKRTDASFGWLAEAMKG